MMATRVSDTELAARLRQRNAVNSQRRRERLALAGKVQLLTWIPATLRRELDSAAAARGEPLSETTAALLLAGLATPATTTPDTSKPPPVYTVEGGDERAALMAEVGKLLNEGHTGNEVARRLTAAGYRSPNGAALTGGNLLRDFRRWQAGKRDATDSHEKAG
jgi:hypothetical protein